MTFLHPAMLWGLAAALIPLAVHLFDRRRPRPVPFGAIAFVLRSQRRTASRLKLKRLLLYLLRTFLLVVVPLALAGPRCSQPDSAHTARGSAATAIVVDASLSTRWRSGTTSLFQRAQKQARQVVSELAPDEPLAVVTCGPGAEVVTPLAFDRAAVLSALDGLTPSLGRADLNRCLEVAARALDESPLPNRRLVVVTALTQGALRLDLPAPATAGPKGEPIRPDVVLRDVAEGEVLANRAIVDAVGEAAPQAGPRAWQFTFTVRNHSPEALRDLEVSLLVDGAAVAKGFIDVPPQGTAQKVFTHRFERGGVMTVEGRLAPDALTDDDVRTLVVQVPNDLKALIVNGAPSTQKVRDEAFFVEAALGATGSPVRATVRDADAAWRDDFGAFDAVLLLNVTAPPADVAAKLVAFVQRGGGLFVSMGDRVDPDAFNASFGAVLPRRLRVVKTAVEPGSAEASTRAARLKEVATGHAVLAPFTGRAREGLLSTRFYRYVLFEADGGGEVLAAMDDGAPVLLTALRGRGRVVAFASTVDRDWCDAPVRTAFLPLMQRLTGWLTGALDAREVLRPQVGEVVTLGPVDGVAPSAVRSPAGNEAPSRALADGLAVGPLPLPGRYAVEGAGHQVLPAAAFAAHLDPSASDTSRHPADAVAGWFGEGVVTTGSSGQPTETPVWTWLFVAATLAFLAEGLLLRT